MSSDEASVGSHHTPEPCDQREVKFRSMKFMSNKNRAKIERGELLVYHKEDMTNFSKYMGLNVVKPANLDPLDYFSDRPRYRKVKKRPLSQKMRDIAAIYSQGTKEL